MSVQTEDRVVARLELHCASLGIAPPPVVVRVSLTGQADAWGILVQARETEVDAGALVSWLSTMAPREIIIDEAREATAYFDGPLRGLGLLPGAYRIEATIDGEGGIALEAEGPREGIQWLFAALQEGERDVIVRQVGPRLRLPRLLTGPQDEAIRVAVHVGYYRIPRKVNLIELAAALGVSAAAASERLRRAEARIVERYVAEEETRSRDASTLSI